MTHKVNVLRMAWRNVWRNTRRSGVTIGAMALALFVLVLYAGLVQGYLRGMEKDIVGLEVGDIQVHAKGYLDRPSLYTRLGNVPVLVHRLAAAGLPASPRLLAGALAAHAQQSAGVQLRGVDVALDAKVSRIDDHLSAGKWLSPGDHKGVVLGKRLAHTLGVKVGGELVLLTQAADGSLANDLFTVRGILGNVSDATDRAAVYMDEATFRSFLAIPKGVHELVIRRPAGLPLAAATAEVARIAHGDDVKSWRQLMPTVSSMLDSAQSAVQVVFVIVYVAVAILILNAMLMAVFERIREFGVLKAIGAGPGRVLSLILVESGVQVSIAIVIGLLLSLPGMWFLATKGVNVGKLGGMSMMGVAAPPIWYGVFDAHTLVTPIVILVVMATLAVVYPALKAAWVRPIEAMRQR